MDRPETWSLVQAGFDPARLRHFESLMTIGSGVLQQRASLEEGLLADPQDLIYSVSPERLPQGAPPSVSRVGTFMPGVTAPHPTCGNELVNLPALHGLQLYAAGERLDLRQGRVRDHIRRLDLCTGRLSRSLVWTPRSGAELRLRYERLVSAARPHLAAGRFEIEHLGGPPAELRIVGPLDAEVTTNGFDHFASVEITGEHEPITLSVQTNAGQQVAAAALLTSDRPIAWSVEAESRWVALAGTCVLDAGRAVRVQKFAAMIASCHVNSSPLDAARQLAWNAATQGYERLAAESDATWAQRWSACDIQIDGDDASQLALRVAIYHLLRAAGEGEAGVGLDPLAFTSETRFGRVTWEHAIFALPPLLYTRPLVAARLARFRTRTLDGARRNARRDDYAGARYAWESDPRGDEHAVRHHPRDHGVHVSADVALGLWHAVLTLPDDLELLRDAVAALVEIARYWSERLTYDAAHDRYEVLMAMGPDEYKPYSRNNAYTCRLAARSLELAGESWRRLAERDPAAAKRLAETLALQPEELARLAAMAPRVRFPRDASGLPLQSDDFADYEPVDLGRLWHDRSQPLSRYMRRERLYRSQVLHQADLVQLFALLPHEFEPDVMRRAYREYEPRTSHEGPPSHAAHCLVAARLRDADEAGRQWQAACDALLSSGGSTEGVSVAACGALWQAAVFGLAGVRSRMEQETLRIVPHLPAAWSGMRFKLHWQGQPIAIGLTNDRCDMTHEGSAPLDVDSGGTPQRLEPGQALTLPVGK